MKNKRGFTLIELLVVIAIIALLLAVIVPSLKLAKQKAGAIICMVNVKNLSLAWFSYKEDNGGRIMSSVFSGTTDPYGSGKRVPPWIEIPQDDAGVAKSLNSGTVTDEDEKRGIRKGALHSYLSKSEDVFNCPSDKVKSRYDSVDPEKFVAYAIPDCLAGEQTSWSGLDPQGKYRVMSFTQITSPSDRYNFVETAEERNFTASGHFVFGAREFGHNPEVWWGPMAVNHGDSSVLGFCDGHAERQIWHDPETKDRIVRLSKKDTATYDRDTESGRNAGNSEDIAYMAQGWAYKHK